MNMPNAVRPQERVGARIRNKAEVLAILVVFLSACGSGRVRFDKLVAEVRRAIPVGTPVRQATLVLDSMRITYSAFDPRTGTVRALKGPIEKNIITRGDAEFVLAFDSTGRLTKINAREVYTGP